MSSWKQSVNKFRWNNVCNLCMLNVVFFHASSIDFFSWAFKSFHIFYIPPVTPSGVIEYVNPYIPTQTLEEYWSDHMQNHQADSPLYVWPDVWSADLHLFIKNMVIHDIECPYWDQMSTQTKLNNVTSNKLNPPVTTLILGRIAVLGHKGWNFPQSLPFSRVELEKSSKWIFPERNGHIWHF